MDTLFHGLLTYLIFRKKKYKFKAGFWGMVPDFFPVVSLIYFIYLGFLNNFEFFNIFLYREALPIYLFLHSLTLYLIISLGLLVFKKKEFWLPLAGGGLHILVDILTHSEGTVKTFYLFYLLLGFSIYHTYLLQNNNSFLLKPKPYNLTYFIRLPAVATFECHKYAPSYKMFYIGCFIRF